MPCGLDVTDLGIGETGHQAIQVTVGGKAKNG
jgi:hypothetical protein